MPAPHGGWWRDNAIFTSLKGGAAAQASLPDTGTHIVLAGAKKPTTTGQPTGFAIPAFDWKISDKEVADLVNYIRSACGNNAPLTGAEAVSKVRKEVKGSGG